MSFREENCKCEEEKGSYSLTKTIDTSDQTVWEMREPAMGLLLLIRR